MSRYDANVRLNVTIEYPDYNGDAIKAGEVKEDLRTLFEGLDLSMSGAHVWVTEVDSTGRPSYID